MLRTRNITVFHFWLTYQRPLLTNPWQKKFGVCVEALDWFQNDLSDRIQCVAQRVIHLSFKGSFPQGSILGLILFYNAYKWYSEDCMLMTEWFILVHLEGFSGFTVGFWCCLNLNLCLMQGKGFLFESRHMESLAHINSKKSGNWYGHL